MMRQIPFRRNIRVFSDSDCFAPYTAIAAGNSQASVRPGSHGSRSLRLELLSTILEAIAHCGYHNRREDVYGLIMDTPLLTSSLIEYAANYHGDTEIVSRTVEGPIHRYTYAEAHARARRLANALLSLGVRRGDRVATMAWNGYRHFELYFAISGLGAVCHTINPRLFEDQLVYIINHAEDRFIFVDPAFVGLLEGLKDRLRPVEGYVVMTDPAHMQETTLPNVVCYETLIGAQSDAYDCPSLDEKLAAGLCYTSGTTGNPKGALYSHRSIVLHSFSCCTADHPLAASCREVILPVVPMFHVQAWGIPYAAALAGAKLVLPGPKLDGESLHGLLDGERVTMTAGVPTVWLGLLDYLKETGKTLDHLECLLVGGSAAPLSMIKAFEEDHGVEVVHAWGMTETSPVATTGRLKRKYLALPREARYEIKLKQGRALYGVEMKIVDDEGRRLPHDGKTAGQLMVRGPWVASAYFRDEAASAAVFDADGWFATGDVVTIDPDGHIHITDRSKDLIKSGGEWISSIDLENAAMNHPDVAEAAAIALAHPKWGERPLLVVVRRDGGKIAGDQLHDFLAGKVAKWWLPDEIVFVDALPHTATGKVSKLELRKIFADHKLPDA
jgi:fatty-acyl-CoA synthase